MSIFCTWITIAVGKSQYRIQLFWKLGSDNGREQPEIIDIKQLPLDETEKLDRDLDDELQAECALGPVLLLPGQAEIHQSLQ